MADTGTRSGTATAKPAAGGTWFTRKIGPLPAWGWGVAAVGAYYWYTHYGPGASKQTAAAQPAAGSGLKTYAPRITETITEQAPKPGARKPPPKKRPPRRKPKPKRPGSRPAAAAMAPAGVNPGGPNRPPGPNPGGPDKKPGRRRKPPAPPPAPEPRPPAPVPPGPEQVASADYQPAGMQTGGAVNADTNQPVYLEWQHAHRGPEVPMPVQAYAPMTSGAVYDAASTGATLAAG